MMRRRWIILILGLVLGVGGYCAFYYCATAKHRHMAQEEESDLLWLKMEFKLSDSDFKRISALHDGYLPKCREMCRRIATKNAELKTIVAQTNTVTPEMTKKLAEIAEVRSECQATMLQHFYEVSQAMPPEQGKRYLEWIQSKTLGFDRSSAHEMGHEMQ
jgi:hypothetical protein